MKDTLQINNLKAKNMPCHSLNFLCLFPFFSSFSRQRSHGLSIRGVQFKTCWKFFVAVWLRATARDPRICGNWTEVAVSVVAKA